MERSVQRSTCPYVYTAALMVLCMGACLVNVSEGAAADLSICRTALQNLLPCLPYSQGTAEVPTQECCTNLKAVHVGEPQCLCELVAASVNGTEGVPKLNTTRSLQLGPACKVATKPSVCPDLLGLSPSDPLNKIFTTGSNSTSSTSTPATSQSSTATTAQSNSPSSNSEGTQFSASLLATFLLSLTAFTVL